MKLRKIKYRTPKCFGLKSERWAKNGRDWYGHYSGLGNPGWRTAAEIRDADDRRILRLEGAA